MTLYNPSYVVILFSNLILDLEVWAVERIVCQECIPLVVGTDGVSVIQSHCGLDFFHLNHCDAKFSDSP